MSEATHKQATHALTTLNQIDLNKEEMKILYSGYLAFVAKAIKKGVIPSFEQFHELVGLGPFKSELLGQPTMIILPACRHCNVLQKFQEDPFFTTYYSFEKQVAGVEEEDIPEIEYAYRKLLSPSIDKKILSALGDKRRGEGIKVFYTHIYEYLKKCPNGWYLFYVGNGMVVRASRGGDHCRLDACSVEDLNDWLAGDVVVFFEVPQNLVQ